MKKKILLLLLVVIPFLTACGSSKTMKCEYKDEDSTAGYIFTFDGDKLQKMSMYEEINFDNVDYSKTMSKSQIRTQAEQEGLSCN